MCFLILFEQLTESCGYRGLKLHGFARAGMREAQQPGMEAQTVDGIVAIAVFGIAAYGMAHVGRMYANLVLATRLQLIFHKRMFGSAVQYMEMRDSQFATIVHRR